MTCHRAWTLLPKPDHPLNSVEVDPFYLCWIFLCGILRLEPECQIGKKLCIYIEIETLVFGMRASALLQPGYESTWALLCVSAQCICMWRGEVIKTSDIPHLMGLCWNLGWILLYKFLLGKMEGEGSEKAGKSGERDGGMAPTSRYWEQHHLSLSWDFSGWKAGSIGWRACHPPCVRHLPQPPGEPTPAAQWPPSSPQPNSKPDTSQCI